jgi:hypothetical protein
MAVPQDNRGAVGRDGGAGGECRRGGRPERDRPVAQQVAPRRLLGDRRVGRRFIRVRPVGSGGRATELRFQGASSASRVSILASMSFRIQPLLASRLVAGPTGALPETVEYIQETKSRP